jgi:hypothetical protein
MSEKKQRLLDFLEKLTDKISGTKEIELEDCECEESPEESNIANLSIKIEHIKYDLANILNKNEEEKVIYLDILNKGLLELNNFLAVSLCAIEGTDNQYEDAKKNYMSYLNDKQQKIEKYLNLIRNECKKDE